MKITKLEHSGLVLEKDDQKLVFDPVEFADTLPKLENVVAIIITHIHSDHFQPEKITEILELNPNAKFFAPEDVNAEISNLTLVAGGDVAEIGDFKLEFFSKDHASVFAGKVPCRNIGVVIDGQVLNPGDSFDLLDSTKPVPVLLVPEVAPWAKISESVEFIKVAKPKYVIPMHDGLLSKMGKDIYDNFLKGICENIGADFVPMLPGDVFDFYLK